MSCKRHGLVGRAGEGLLDARFEHLAAVDDRLDVRDGAEGRVLAQGRPVAVVGDEPGPVIRDVLVEQLLHGQRQGLEHLALFHRGDPLEGVDVVRMHREEAHELVHALVHAAVELGEGGQVLPDFHLLVGGLLEQTLGHHELDVLAGDEDLLEAVLHPADAVGHEGEARAVEDGFLDTGDEAEPQVLADLADLAQEVEVEDQLLVLARAQVVEQLVHHQEQAVVGILLVEGGHHLLEGALVVGHLVRGREGVGHAHGGQVLLQFGHEDVAQGHGGRADFGSDHLEAAADLARGTRHALVVQVRREIAVFGQGGDHGHEVRLTGAVVADDQQPLVVHGLVELKLRNDQVDQLLGHLLGDDVGLDKLPGSSGLVGVPQLDHGLDGLELDQVSVFHRVCLPALSFLVFMRWPPGSLPGNLVRDIVCIRDGPASRRPCAHRRWSRSRPRPPSCSARAPAGAAAGPA